MAVAFACCSIYFHHLFRSEDNKLALVNSMVFLSLALLSAEAGIATFAYLFAYAVTLDKQGPFKAIVTLIPAITVIVFWRLLYNLSDFGARGIGLYIDPMYSPLEFIESLFLNYGVLALTQIVDIDLSLVSVNPTERIAVQLTALALSAAAILLIIKPLKRKPLIRFFFLGSIVSLIPFCALVFNNPRNLFFSSLGFFPIAAYLMLYLWRQKQSLVSRGFISLVALFYLILPIIGTASITFKLPLIIIEEDGGSALAQFKSGGGSQQQDNIVYLSYSGGLALYLPYTWDWQNEKLPQHLYQIAPGLNSYTLNRTDSHKFSVKADTRFALSANSPLSGKASPNLFSDSLYSYQSMHSMTSSPRANFKTGDTFTFPHYQVIITAADNGEVNAFYFIFAANTNPEKMDWRYWDWKQSKFLSQKIPATGESLYVANKWDFKAKNKAL